MANVLVLMELCRGAMLPASLEALGQGRRISTALGATLYALVPLPDAPAYGENDLIALCARHGADKVVLLTGEGISAEREMRYGTHGSAVLAALEQFPPTVLLLAATRAARDVAPRLAARLAAAYLPEGWVSPEQGRLALWDREGRPILADEQELEHAVVVTIPPGRYLPAVGDDEAEMLIVAGEGRPDGFTEVEQEEEVACLWTGAAGGLCRARPPPAPSLVVGVSAPVPQVDGALRVALGQGADVDAAAHYALPGDPGEALARLAAALGGAEGP
ncbi:MAG: hypothetical protein NZ890_01995 [Myxococcota bacterium]|nr:hypothetical protein [Myxococcota bacterium]